MALTDAEFLQQFEDKSLAPEYFNHHGHLRLAWLYLSQQNLNTAIDKITHGISSYATSLGATDKFNYTLTAAIMKIMDQRMQTGAAPTLEIFLMDNQDLVNEFSQVLAQYYSKKVLFSNTARFSFVNPDLKPFSDSNPI